MATLNNPVNKFNLVDRFYDFVAATANAGITWGTDVRPPYFTPAYLGFEPFGGTTSGIAINRQTVADSITGNVITASTIYNVLVQETQKYSNIRFLRALVNVTGGGGNTPAGPETPVSPGIIYDGTAKAHMSTAYLQATGAPANAGVAAEQQIRAANLESFFTNLRTQYTVYRNATVTITTNVCHASCHSSCHASRSRR